MALRHSIFAFLICGFSLLQSSPSFAEIQRFKDFCLGYENFDFVNLGNYKKETGLEFIPHDCAEFSQFDDLAREVTTLVGFNNAGMGVFLASRTIDSNQNHIFDQLSIGLDEDLRYSKPVFVHELGHGLLSEYLIENSNFFDQVRENRRESKKVSKMTMKYYSLLDKGNECRSDECQHLFQEIKFLYNANRDKEINKFWLDRQQTAEFLEIGKHYQELFSDFLAVLYYEDPNIIRDALAHILKQSPESEECRSFLYSADLKEEKRGAHCSLSFVRKELYEKMKVAKSAKEKKEITDRFLRIIRIEIERNLARYRSENKDLTSFPDLDAKRELQKAILGL